MNNLLEKYEKETFICESVGLENTVYSVSSNY